MRPCRILAVMASATEATPAPDTPECVRLRCAVREWHGHDAGRSPARAALCPVSCREGCNGRENRSPSGGGISPPCQGRPLGQMTNRVARRWLSYEAHLAPSAPAGLFRRKFFAFEKRTRLNRLAQASPRLLHL